MTGQGARMASSCFYLLLVIIEYFLSFSKFIFARCGCVSFLTVCCLIKIAVVKFRAFTITKKDSSDNSLLISSAIPRHHKPCCSTNLEKILVTSTDRVRQQCSNFCKWG